MTTSDILQELIRIRPEFQSYWDRDNYYRAEDGSFSTCGVFSRFTDFFREKHTLMSREEVQAVAKLVAICEKDTGLCEAAYTCFLENIAGDSPDTTLTPFLSVAAIDHISRWRPEN